MKSWMKIFMPLMWIVRNTAESCLIAVFLVSFLPFFMNGHGVKFFSFFGGYWGLCSMISLKLNYKDDEKYKPSKLFNVY